MTANYAVRGEAFSLEGNFRVASFEPADLADYEVGYDDVEANGEACDSERLRKLIGVAQSMAPVDFGNNFHGLHLQVLGTSLWVVREPKA